MRQLNADELDLVSGGGRGNNASAHNGIIGGMLAGAGTGAAALGTVGFFVRGPIGAAVGGALGAGVGAVGGALVGFGDSEPPKQGV